MPLPAAALPPAAGALYAGAAAAAAGAKSLALRAAPLIDMTTLSTASIAAWLLRYFWKNKVPDWAKEDVSFRTLFFPIKKRRQRKNTKNRRSQRERTSSSNSHDDNDISDYDSEDEQTLSASEIEEREMANLSSVLEKLQSLGRSVELGDGYPTGLQQHAAFLAYIQLMAQIRKQEELAGKIQEKSQEIASEIDVDDREKKIMDTEQEAEEKKESEESTLIEAEAFAGMQRESENNSKLDIDETLPPEFWPSRDALFDASQPSPTTLPSISQELLDFVENPSESSYLNKLQHALEIATWAYYSDSKILENRLNDHDYELLQHSLSTRPGHVAHYVAVSSRSKRQLIVGIRGTSTLEDIVTDCCGRPVPFFDEPYYYDHDRGTKWNRLSNHQDPSGVEVKAATELQIIKSSITTMKQDVQETLDVEEVEIIRGKEERIWVEEHANATKKSGNCRSKNTKLIDANAQIEYYNNSQNSKTDNNKQRPPFHLLHCHEGIMVSARRLVDKIQAHIEYWVLERGYEIVMSGHSLGAGCASLCAYYLRSRLPELTLESKGRSNMQVYCFAPPPVLDQDAAVKASTYCTSIVNNADLIPRCSLENLLVLLEVLKGVWEELKCKNQAPVSTKTTATFFRRIAKGLDAEQLMTASSVRRLMLSSLKKVQTKQQQETVLAPEDNSIVTSSETTVSFTELKAAADSNEPAQETPQSEEIIQKIRAPTPLYIPGKVLLAYEPWTGKPLQEKTKDVDGDGDSDGQDCDPLDYVLPSMLWKVTDGTADVFHFLDMDASPRMFTDHATTSYYSLLGLEYQF